MKHAALLLASTLPLFLGAGESTAQPVESRRISVLGRATIEAVPDYAIVTVGVSTRAATPTAALDENSAAIRRTIAFSTRFGVEARDIQTTSVEVRDVTESDLPLRRQPTAAERYQAGNSVTVRIRSVARLGEYLRAVLEAGSNRINGVSFGLSNIEQVTDDARAAAVEDAARKARRLVEAAGVKLGPVQQINHPPRAEYRSSDGQADLPRRRTMVDVPIEVGTLEVDAEVDVTWLVE